MTRRSVLTLYGHRPAEVGLPSDNPNLTDDAVMLGAAMPNTRDPGDGPFDGEVETVLTTTVS